MSIYAISTLQQMLLERIRLHLVILGETDAELAHKAVRVSEVLNVLVDDKVAPIHSEGIEAVCKELLLLRDSLPESFRRHWLWSQFTSTMNRLRSPAPPRVRTESVSIQIG